MGVENFPLAKYHALLGESFVLLLDVWYNNMGEFVGFVCVSKHTPPRKNHRRTVIKRHLKNTWRDTHEIYCYRRIGW